MSFPGWGREGPKRGCRGRKKILQETVQLSSPFPSLEIINFRKIFEYFFQNSGWPCWGTMQSVDVHREAFSLQASSNCLSLVFHCSIFLDSQQKNDFVPNKITNWLKPLHWTKLTQSGRCWWRFPQSWQMEFVGSRSRSHFWPDAACGPLTHKPSPPQNSESDPIWSVVI